MRVLITGQALNTRGGVQSFVRTLARGLERLGHSVMTYGGNLVERERLLETDVVPVATDLEHLPLLPDLIHAQHHLDAMTALGSLPTVPAIYHTHGATWRGCVPKHPRIYRYLAMSRTLAYRVSVESNIDPADIDVFLNSVELGRFPAPRSLPPVPATALFYNSRHAADSSTVEAIRAATARMQMTLDCVGFHFDGETASPERLLPKYDVVFAAGLSAIEAIVCGCAVVVLGRTSCGPLVQPDNYEHFRLVNFSIAVNSPPPSADRIEAELRQYSAERCREVTSRLRADADIDVALPRLVRIYEDVVARHRAAVSDPSAENMAMARYLRRLVPLIQKTDELLGRHWASASRPETLKDLSARVALLEQRLQRTS